jgi:RNA polymerase sigma factor (sigma-70 family)
MSARGPAGEPHVGESRESSAAESQKGHRSALADVARDHHSDLVRDVRLRTGSPVGAEDDVQEAYARVLAVDLPDTAGLSGYVRVAARNLAANRARDLARHARIHELIQWEVEAVAPSPERQVYSEQLLSILEEAVKRLPTKLMEVFVLRFVSDLSCTEIAQQLRIPKRTVELYAASALQRCQKYLDSAETAGRATK